MGIPYFSVFSFLSYPSCSAHGNIHSVPATQQLGQHGSLVFRVNSCSIKTHSYSAFSLEFHPALSSKQHPALMRTERSQCCTIGWDGRTRNDINYGSCGCHHHHRRRDRSACILITHMFMLKIQFIPLFLYFLSYHNVICFALPPFSSTFLLPLSNTPLQNHSPLLSCLHVTVPHCSL